MAKHPVPKKKQAVSRSKRRYTVFKLKRQKKLTQMVSQVMDMKRRSSKATSPVKRTKKVTTIKA